MAFYQSELVKIIPTGTPDGGSYIPAVQSAGVSFSIPRQDVSVLGRFAPMPYRQANQWPTFTLNIEYIPTGSDVEDALGLKGANSVIDHLISGAYGRKMSNYKVQVRDIYGDSSEVGTLNLRTGVVTNYSFQASVGQTPKTSITVECLDIGFDAESTIVPPSLNLDGPMLRPQDIEATIPTGIVGLSEIALQSFNISIPLQRTPLLRLGESKPFSRELQGPVIAQIQMNGYVQSFDSTNNVSGDSSQIGYLTCGKWIDDNIIVRVKTPTECGIPESNMITYYISRPYLDNFNISNSVGGYTSVDLQFSVPVTFERGSGQGNLIIY